MQDKVLSWNPPELSPSCRSTLYLQVPLSAVLSWDDATKQRLLFESFVFSGQTEGNNMSFSSRSSLVVYTGTECARLVNKKHAFDYYVSRSSRSNSVNYLTSGLPPIENAAPCPSYIVSLCSTMMNSTSYLKHTLIDELAR